MEEVFIKVSNKDSKIGPEDDLVQVTLFWQETEKTCWIKAKYAQPGNKMTLKDDDVESRKWTVKTVYGIFEKAKFILVDPESIWETQPINRGNK